MRVCMSRALLGCACVCHEPWLHARVYVTSRAWMRVCMARRHARARVDKCVLVSRLDLERQEYENQMDGLNDYMKAIDLPAHSRARVRSDCRQSHATRHVAPTATRHLIADGHYGLTHYL